MTSCGGVKEFETKKDEQAAHEAYKTTLQSTSGTEADDILWVQKAVRSCLQEPKQMQGTLHKEHYTSDDWDVHGNLSALRSMRIQMLADALEGSRGGRTFNLVARAKRKIAKQKVVFQDQDDYL